MSLAVAPTPIAVDRAEPQAGRPTAPVRVLHVVPSLFGGGMERVMLRLIEGLSERNRTQPAGPSIVQGVCVLQRGDEALVDRCRAAVPTWVLSMDAPCRWKRRWRLVNLLRDVMDDFSPDVVHARTTSVWFDTVLAAGRQGDRRVLLSFHGKTHLAEPAWPRLCLNRWLCRRADAVLAVSREAGAMIVAQWNAPPGRLIVIPNSVDTDRFRPAASQEQRCESDIDKASSGSPPTVACVANLVPIKNIACLIEAWRQVTMVVPGARLWLIGDGPHRDALEALARRLRCDESVVFLGARDDTPALLRRADLFVLPSRYEACSNAVLEAMATGLAVVACDVGGTHELIEQDHTGRLVAPGRADLLANAVIELLRNERLRTRLARAARRYVLEHHAQKCWLDDYAGVYVKLAER